MNQAYGLSIGTMVWPIALCSWPSTLSKRDEVKTIVLFHNWIKNQSRNIGHLARVIALHFQVTLKRLINMRFWPHQSALALVKRDKWDTTCKTIDTGCVYACAPHKVQVKWTHSQSFSWVNSERLRDCHECIHNCWETLSAYSQMIVSIISLNLK